MFQLQKLAVKFENLKMYEHEEIVDFNTITFEHC